MIHAKNTIVAAMALLCVGFFAKAEESTKAAVPAVNTLELHKKLLEINQKRKQSVERRASIVSKLRSVIKSFNKKGIIINKEMTILAQELSSLEKKLDHKKKTCEHIKELRNKLETAKTHMAHSAETDLLITVVKQLEGELKVEEQLIAEEAHVRAALGQNSEAWASLEADLAAHRNHSFLRSLVKPVLAFAAGAGVVALLHWRKIITIPQVA